jgi:hypothetical protein
MTKEMYWNEIEEEAIQQEEQKCQEYYEYQNNNHVNDMNVVNIKEKEMEKSLYKIEKQYLDIINQAQEMEGELTSELESALEITKNELEVKSIAYVEVIKAKESFNTRIDEEIKRLQAMKKSNDKLVDRLKNNLLNAVNMFGNFEAGFLKLSTRKSKSVEVNIDTNDLPKEFKSIKVTESADKAAIKKAIEQGKEIEGCILVTKLNLQIK